MATSPEERYKIIGENLKNERTRRKLTQVDLAAMMNSNERVVRNHEKGKPMKMETLFAYANALECSCEDLFNKKKTGDDARILRVLEGTRKLPLEQQNYILGFVENGLNLYNS